MKPPLRDWDETANGQAAAIERHGGRSAEQCEDPSISGHRCCAIAWDGESYCPMHIGLRIERALVALHVTTNIIRKVSWWTYAETPNA